MYEVFGTHPTAGTVVATFALSSAVIPSPWLKPVFPPAIGSCEVNAV